MMMGNKTPENKPKTETKQAWHCEEGSPIQILNFHSLEHLTLQAAPPPAKRRAANHISPQPAFSQVQPQPPVFCIFQEEPTRQCGVHASQAARQVRDERNRSHTQGQEVLPHQLPFPSLIQDAMRRVTAIRQEAYTLLHIITTQTQPNNQGQRPIPHHRRQCFLRTEVRQVRSWLRTTKGPEFTTKSVKCICARPKSSESHSIAATFYHQW